MKNTKIVFISTILLLFVIITILTTNQNVKNDTVMLSNNITLQNNVKEIEIKEKEIDSITVATVTTSRSNVDRTKKENYKSLDEVVISKDMDLTVKTGLSKQDFVKLLTDLSVDRSGFFEENAEVIYDLCQKYEINEVFFCGLIAAESGWNIASNHRTTNNFTSLMVNGKLKQYASVEEGLEASAKLLHNNYLTEGGSFYCGKTLSGVQRRYCPNSNTWVNLVFGCMKQIIK